MRGKWETRKNAQLKAKKDRAAVLERDETREELNEE